MSQPVSASRLSPDGRGDGPQPSIAGRHVLGAQLDNVASIAPADPPESQSTTAKAELTSASFAESALDLDQCADRSLA